MYDKTNPGERVVLSIDGSSYDVTDFLHLHPGGASILVQARGYNSSMNFHAYHSRKINIAQYPQITKLSDDAAKQYSICGTDVVPFIDTTVLAQLNMVVRKARPPHNLDLQWRICWVFSLWLGVYAHWVYTLSIVSSIMLGLWSFPTVINLFHTQTHRQDQRMSWSRYFYDILGASSEVWQYQHNVLHHQETNTLEDPDVHHAMPLVRFHPDQPYFWYHRFQYLYTPVLYLLTTFGFMFQSFVCTFCPGLYIRLLNPKAHTGETSKWQYVWTKAVGLLVFFGIPIHLGHTFSSVTRQFILFHLVFGFILGVLLEASHISTHCTFHDPDGRPSGHPEWIRGQVRNTVNIDSDSLLANILYGGLNTQAEHHLFPALDHLELFHVSKPLRIKLAALGIPVQEDTTWQSVRKHFGHIYCLSRPP
jgi:hypothetical protein